MKDAFGMMYEWSGVFPPPNPDPRFNEAQVADATLTYYQFQPEQAGELIASKRSGRLVNIEQDVTGLAYANTYPYVTYSFKPENRTPIADVYANILSSPSIPGVK